VTLPFLITDWFRQRGITFETSLENAIVYRI